MMSVCDVTLCYLIKLTREKNPFEGAQYFYCKSIARDFATCQDFLQASSPSDSRYFDIEIVTHWGYSLLPNHTLHIRP